MDSTKGRDKNDLFSPKIDVKLKSFPETKEERRKNRKRKIPLLALVPLMEVSTFDLEGIQLPMKQNLTQHPISFSAPAFCIFTFDLPTSKLPA